MIQLRFREVDRDIFEAIRKGKKKVETRAASPRFIKMKTGDCLKLVCGKDSFEKRVKKARIFKTISAMLKKYKAKEINPLAKSKNDLESMYDSFPNYREKIKKYGLMVLELE
jgi:ASC-1-like (ASCH) protein